MVAMINNVVSFITGFSYTQRPTQLETGGKVVLWRWEKTHLTDFCFCLWRAFIWGSLAMEPGTMGAHGSLKDVIQSGDKK